MRSVSDFRLQTTKRDSVQAQLCRCVVRLGREVSLCPSEARAARGGTCFVRSNTSHTEPTRLRLCSACCTCVSMYLCVLRAASLCARVMYVLSHSCIYVCERYYAMPCNALVICMVWCSVNLHPPRRVRQRRQRRYLTARFISIRNVGEARLMRRIRVPTFVGIYIYIS